MKKILILSMIALTLVYNTSCIKKDDLNSEDLGPAVEPMEFTKTLTSAFGVYDYNLIKPGEVSSLVMSYRLQDSFSQVFEKQVIDIKNVDNQPDQLVLSMQYTKVVNSGGQDQSSTSEKHIAINKTGSLSTLADDNELPLLLFYEFIGIVSGYCRENSPVPTSCHKLTAQDLTLKVPASEASHHNCPDANNCTIPAKKIEFDLILKNQFDDNGNPIRNHYTIVLSPEVPFLSRVLQFCQRGLHKLGSSEQQVVADVCYTVDSYTFGN